VAKQTGPLRAVKTGTAPRLALTAAALVLAVGLSACASSWHHPTKTGPVAAADERACAQLSEENALTRAGRQRADYRLGTPEPLPGMNRGETPMQMLDRRATQDDYSRDFESCMRSRGYTQD